MLQSVARFTAVLSGKQESWVPGWVTSIFFSHPRPYVGRLRWLGKSGAQLCSFLAVLYKLRALWSDHFLRILENVNNYGWFFELLFGSECLCVFFFSQIDIIRYQSPNTQWTWMGMSLLKPCRQYRYFKFTQKYTEEYSLCL